MTEQDRPREERLLKTLLTVDRRLKKAGWHGLSPAFLDVFGKFIASGKRTMVLRKGRRGGGTTSTTEFIAAYLQTDIPIPKGDRGTFIFLAQNLATARDNLRREHECLEALEVEHEFTIDRITLAKKPIDLRVFAPNIVTSRGVTCVGAFIDEACHIRSDSGDDVLQGIVEQSVVPAMATIPGAPLLLVSSPAGFTDYHAQRFAEGTDERQEVFCIPSFVGNPSLSEETCRELAGGEVNFLREYAAEAVESTTTKPFLNEWISALDHIDPGSPEGPRVCATDISSGAHDGWVWVIAGWNKRADGSAVLSIDLADGCFGKWAVRMSADDVFDKMAADAKRCGATVLFTDQRDSNHSDSGCKRHGLKRHIMQHRTETKVEAVKMLQLLLEHCQVAVPERGRERIKRALRDYQQSETAGGRVRFGGRGTRPDDFVACLLTLMMALTSGLVEGGLNRSRPKHKDPPPRAGSPLRSWSSSTRGPSSHPIDRIRIDNCGRTRSCVNQSAIWNRGGF